MFTVERFVEECVTANREGAPEAAVREVVARWMAHPDDVDRALGTPTQDGITTLHHSPELTILQVVWDPGMAIYPHDHRIWAVIGMYGGREDNVFYRRSPEGLQRALQERPYDVENTRRAFREAHERWLAESREQGGPLSQR